MNLDKSRRVIGAEWCSELVPGSPYFTVSYQESGVNLPEVETLVYLGTTQVEEQEGQAEIGFLFQAARSYQQDGDWGDLPDKQREALAADGAVMFYDEGSVVGVADIDGLLVLLNGLRERMRRGLGWDRVLPEEER